MGTWGVGLYAGDFAADLRAAVSAVARLPFDGDRLAQILSDIEPGAAANPADEDHSTFWLVAADQFARRGISSPLVRTHALTIIDSGTDLESLAARGMPATALARRSALLSELRARIEAPAAPRRGAILKKPQAFVMAIGEVFTYPTSNGCCINSYFSSKLKIPGWSEDGWGAMVIVDRGHAFDFLAWYRPLVMTVSAEVCPSTATLRAIDAEWVLRRPGTCSAVHFRRLELSRVAVLPIDRGRLLGVTGPLRPGTSQAINDISIANELGTLPASGERPRPLSSEPPLLVRGLATILES
jgi:hypothetical protein